jgi:hypothetical protein
MADKRGGIGIAPGRGPGPSRAGVAGTSSDSDSDLAEYGTAPSAPQTPRLRGMSLGALGFAGFGTPSTFASPGASAIALDETAPLLSPFMTPRSPRTPKNTQRKHRPRMHRRGSSRRSARGRRAPPIYVFPAIFLLILFLLALFAAWDVTLGGCRVAWVCDLLGGEPIDEVWARTTGAYAPWRSRGPDGDVAPLPKGCVVDQVSVVSISVGKDDRVGLTHSCIGIRGDIRPLGRAISSVQRSRSSRSGGTAHRVTGTSSRSSHTRTSRLRTGRWAS